MKLILSIIASLGILTGILVATVPALNVIVVGHTQDLISRTTSDQIIHGNQLSIGIFDETSDGRDAAHWANGTVKVVENNGKRYVQLSEDFVSGPLPDGHVYVSASKDINNNQDFDTTVQIELGKLIKGSGASYYEIPTDVVVNSVTILCKRFHVFISSADVSPTYFERN